MNRKVIIEKTVTLYHLKAPFVSSGKSLRGALEYEETTDQVRCHECGEWFVQLARHIAAAHSMKAKEYKAKHGLRNTSALIGERARQNMILSASTSQRITAFLKHRKSAAKGKRNWKKPISPEAQNTRGHCVAQVIDKIRAAKEVIGKVPTVRELEEYGVPRHVVRLHFQTHANALRIAGLNGRTLHENRYSDAELKNYIVNIADAKQRLPGRSDQRRGLIPSRQVYINRFGSWRKAVTAAGVKATWRGNIGRIA